jgi:hypothetical protein
MQKKKRWLADLRRQKESHFTGKKQLFSFGLRHAEFSAEAEETTPTLRIQEARSGHLASPVKSE